MPSCAMTAVEDALLPPHTEVCILQTGAAAEGNADGADEASDGEEFGGKSARWITATVVKAKVRKSEGEDARGYIAQHSLRFPDGSAKWVCLADVPFLVHPIQRRAREEDASADQQTDKAMTESSCAWVAVHFTGYAPKPGKAKFGEAPSSMDQQRKWNAQVRRAASVGDMAELIQSSCAWFDPVNVSGSLNCLAKRAPFAASDATAAWAAISCCVERAANDGLVGYGAQAIANICWSMAKVGLQVQLAQPSVRKVFSLAVRRVLEDIHGAVVWLRKESFKEDAWTADCWGGWKPQEIANFCWALMRSCGAKASPDIRRFLGVVAQGATLAKWVGFSSQELANTLSGLCAFGLAPPLLVQRCLAKVQKYPKMFKPQEMCQVLNAATRSNIPREKLRPLLAATLKDAAAVDFRGFITVDLANLTWALGAVRMASGKFYHIEEELVEDCADFIMKVITNAKESLEAWRPNELASLLYSLSRLGLVDIGLFRLACESWQTWLSNPEAEETPPGALSSATLANVVLACARVGYADAELQLSVCQRARSAVRSGEGDCPWSVSSILNTLWSGACTLAMSDSREAAAGSAPAAESVSALAKGLLALLRTVWKAIEQGSMQFRGKARIAVFHVVYAVLHSWGKRTGGIDWEPPPEVLSQWRSAYTWPSQESEFQNSVGAILREAVVPELFPKGSKQEDEVDVGGFFADIVITPPDGTMRLAIEVDGPTHFVRPVRLLRKTATASSQSRILNGQSRMKRFILHRLGGAIPVSVPYYDWELCKEKADRAALLTGLLRAAASAYGGALPGPSSIIAEPGRSGGDGAGNTSATAPCKKRRIPEELADQVADVDTAPGSDQPQVMKKAKKPKPARLLAPSTSSEE